MGELKSCVKAENKQSLSTEIQSSLKQEILHLQQQLDDQLVVRSALEKALTNQPLSHDPTNKNSITKPAEDLIKEIAVLELEVVFLEKHLLSMYRKTFDERVLFLSTLDGKSQSKSPTHKRHGHNITRKNVNFSCFLPPEDLVDNPLNDTVDTSGAKELVDSSIHRSHSSVSQPSASSKNENFIMNFSRFLPAEDLVDNPLNDTVNTSGAKKLVDSSIHCSHSSVSQPSACSFRTPPPMGTLTEAVNSYHSLPLSMLERAEGATANVTSLAEQFGTSVPDHILETPNWLSEEMIKCISAIYVELADPPLINHGSPSSPISFSSSISDSSPQRQYDTCSTEPRKTSSFHSCTDNPFNIGSSKEFSGSYRTMLEVQWICRDSQRLRCVNHMLQNFRSLVSRLEEVDPKKMKHDQKLAFWINIHNTLVMHAFLVYGIPHNNLKRISLLLKAAYNVGGHTINIDVIQNSILGCRLPRPGQWLQSLLFPKTKLKVRDARKAYAVEHPEPRLFFALCSGSFSDPAVRMYTPNMVFQELEAAKEDYIHTNFKVHKEQKILLPKIVDSFAKELGLCQAGFIEMIEHFMPDSLRKSVQQHQHGKLWKRIEWTPYDFTFRYLLSKELAK